MFRYLRAAFWAAPTLPGVGRLPLNVIAFSGLMILGFGHPGFWLLGVALEASWLFALSCNGRFQRLVDFDAAQLQSSGAGDERVQMAARLGPAGRGRSQELEGKCERIVELERNTQTDEFVMAGNREALDKLSLLHLKLLVAQQTVQSVDGEKLSLSLQAGMKAIDEALATPGLSSSLRDSKKATRRILEQRMTNLARREQTLQEIESDLTRIEAQIDLALDNAGLRDKSESISANIRLASQLLDGSGAELDFSLATASQSFDREAQ